MDSSAIRVGVAPGRLPLLGHALPVRRDPLGFLRSLPEHGDIVRLQLGPRPVYLFTDPHLAHELLIGRCGRVNRDGLADAGQALFGRSLAVISGRAHRARRRLYSPPLRAQAIPRYVAAIEQQTRAVTGSWHDGAALDLDQQLLTVSLATMCAALYGTHLAPAQLRTVQTHLPRAVTAAFDLGAVPAPLRWSMLRSHRRLRSCGAALRQVMSDVVQQARTRGNTGDLVSALLFDTDAELGRPLSHSEVVDEMCGLLEAGVDTPATALGWALYEIAEHAAIAEQLYAELDAVLCGGPVTAEHLDALPFTRWVIQEVLRKYSSWIVPMRTESDLRIGGTVIPAGSVVAVSLYLIHHDPRFFPDPDRFDPQRWSPERGQGFGHEAAIPFSAGARKCPGDSFAMTELLIQLATIATQWRFEPVPHTTVRTTVRGVVIRPERLPMVARRRGGPSHTPAKQCGRG
ncbi:cytochrome P450 [Nocardia iowensis]|uniref:Cytochrome P450 n=1 Tax=Nocardia iowensis TaxID=204891 RepID=A0ABX8RZ91_NOCIO|nr:cytochrome P450 [Nocardia iowensis]QXN94506.1 cytochrome P450 [Nocardia iowensis]